MKTGFAARQNVRAKDTVCEIVSHAKTDITQFEAVFEHYFSPIMRYTLSKVSDQQAAEDIVSQTFLTAMEKLKDYREKGRFSAWIFTIARSKINDYFRKQKHASSMAISQLPAKDESMLAKHIAIEEISRLRKMISHLPERKRDLIRLRYAADLSFREIGDIIGKSEGAVKKALYRIQQGLKRDMESGHA